MIRNDLANAFVEVAAQVLAWVLFVGAVVALWHATRVATAVVRRRLIWRTVERGTVAGHVLPPLRSTPAGAPAPPVPAQRLRAAHSGAQSTAAQAARRVLLDHTRGLHDGHDRGERCTYPGCEDAYWLLAGAP